MVLVLRRLRLVCRCGSPLSKCPRGSHHARQSRDREEEGVKRTIVEGCLSVPGFQGNVKRAVTVKVKARDRNGREVRITPATTCWRRRSNTRSTTWMAACTPISWSPRKPLGDRPRDLG